jgi:predicted kinase
MMEAVIFIGIQGTGKSTFYKQQLVDTHVRINGDMLKTKHREKLIIEACLKAKQSFVVDKMNLTIAERAKYIEAAKSHHFQVVGYYFRSNFAEALARNNLREGKQRIPAGGLGSALKRLQKPHFEEGFNALFHVFINENSEFVIETWSNQEKGEE